MFELKKELIIEKYQKENTTFEELLNNIEMQIIKYEPHLLEVDLINIDCSIANTLRRILMSEIPIIAIHRVVINKYDGVMPEEILIHRLGLLPVIADAYQFQFQMDEHLDEFTTAKFKLCKKNESDDVMTIYSDDIEWIPLGTQLNRLNRCSIKSGIPITKLSKGQYIDFEMYCEKNMGKEHAKWSGACTVCYRTMPIIEVKDVTGQDAYKLKECFSDGVIEIQRINGVDTAVVVNPRIDTMSREALRHNEFEDKVFIGKKSDHFIFTLETITMDPLIMFKQGIHVFLERSKQLREEIAVA